MFDKESTINLINKSEVLLGERNYKRILELIDIEPNWDGKNASSINFESLVKTINFLNSKNVISNNLCIFFDYEGFVILDWKNGDIKNELTFKDNSNLYWNSIIDDSMALLDSHLKYLNFESFESIMNKFSPEEIDKLMLISNIENELTKNTVDYLINIAITEDYECRYAPSYAVDKIAFINLIKFLEKFKIKDIYLWTVATREIEGHVKSERYEIEFDFKKDLITIFKYPLSDNNILDLNIKDLDKFNNIDDILDSIK